MAESTRERPDAGTARAPARKSVCEYRRVGSYDILVCDDAEGPEPDPGQFYMLAAAQRWGGGADERPFLPRAFSVMRRGAGRLEFMLEDVGPGTAAAGRTARGRRAVARRPVRDRLRAATRRTPPAARRRRCRHGAAWRSGRTTLGPADAGLPARLPRRRARQGRGAPDGARVATDDGSRRPQGPGHRPAAGRDPVRSARRDLCLRSARDARGRARDLRGARVPGSSHWSPAWRAGTAPASAVSWPPSTATSASASTGRCWTPPISTNVSGHPDVPRPRRSGH